MQERPMTAPDPLASLRGRGPFRRNRCVVADNSDKTALVVVEYGTPHETAEAVARALNFALEADAKLAAAREEIEGLKALVEKLNLRLCGARSNVTRLKELRHKAKAEIKDLRDNEGNERA